MIPCRHCTAPLERVLVDLGHQPPSNAYLPAEALALPEATYPLRVFVCERCWLVQLPAHAPAEALFTKDYAYFSSMSAGWLAHARTYVTDMTARFDLRADSFVAEVASNDGYLLRHADADA